MNVIVRTCCLFRRKQSTMPTYDAIKHQPRRKKSHKKEACGLPDIDKRVQRAAKSILTDLSTLPTNEKFERWIKISPTIDDAAVIYEVDRVIYHEMDNAHIRKQRHIS